MKKLLVLTFMLIFSFPVFAEEIATQKITNEKSYCSVNVEKQPAKENSKQIIANKNSWFNINIVINGKIKEDSK